MDEKATHDQRYFTNPEQVLPSCPALFPGLSLSLALCPSLA